MLFLLAANVLNADNDVVHFAGQAITLSQAMDLCVDWSIDTIAVHWGDRQLTLRIEPDKTDTDRYTFTALDLLYGTTVATMVVQYH